MNPFSFLGKALSDGENPSAMRLVMVLGVLVIIGVWALASWHGRSVAEFPQSVVEVLGALLVGKVVQTHLETRNDGTK